MFACVFTVNLCQTETCVQCIYSYTPTHELFGVFILQAVNPLHFTPYCFPFGTCVCALSLEWMPACDRLSSALELCLRAIINQICLCMLGRLSSSEYGNKLDCSLTRETETLNGAKKNSIFPSLPLAFILFENTFILPSRVVFSQQGLFQFVYLLGSSDEILFMLIKSLPALRLPLTLSSYVAS